MTMCSGIGAPEVAAPWVDWRFASEIEAFPREVLQQRLGYKLPEDQNQGEPLLWGDMTEITPDLMRANGIPLPDLIVAGTPCQAFSIAGLRKGTADERGNLTLKFVEICHDIVAARPDGKLAVLWENVPGVLSDKGNAFGCFLGGLVGAMDALQSPGDESWPREGMVQGPRARAAWCVLDAQWFGVAQRRRRVFVVVDFGNCCDPAAILLEPDRLRGNTPPRRETGQNVAGTLSARSEGGGGLGTDFELGGGLQADWPKEVAPTLNAHFGDKMGLEDQHALSGAGLFVPAPQTATGPVTHALTAEGHDASEDGTGRGTPIVAFDCKGTEVQTDESGVTPPLRSMGHHNSHSNAGGHAAVAFDTTQITSLQNGSNPKPGDACHPLAAGAHPPAVAFDLRGRDGGAQFEGPHDTANLRAASGGSSRSYVSTPAVRRLTPTECHRLQGFSDDWCAIERNGKPAADGPQYKALGNSMAVPVIAWILDRLRISREQYA